MASEVASPYIGLARASAAFARRDRWRGAMPVAGVYLLATLFTRYFFLADSIDYVESIATGIEFWEFGHLFWRPAGWLLTAALGPAFHAFGIDDAWARTLWSLMAMNWIAGLVSAILIRDLAERLTSNRRVALIVAAAFIFSQAVLNYVHTGASYMPGLMFLLLGMSILLKNGEAADRPWRTALLAGGALAAAVFMWFLYVWAIPAALALPLCVFGFNRSRARLALLTAAAAMLAGMLAYGAVLTHLGIHDIAGAKAWVMSAGHGLTGVSGAARVVFGLPRSFINMGDDGVLFKRFLVGDPYNPVSVFDLARNSLGKLALFYLFLAAVLLNLWRTNEGRRMLLLIGLAGAGVIGFAVAFDGGAIERYLPFYPFAFMGLAVALASARALRWLNVAAYGFLVLMAAVNVSVMAVPVVAAREAALVARVADLQANLKPNSRVFTVRDELHLLDRDFPLNPFGRARLVESIVTPGLEETPVWRERFAAEVEKIWRAGGDVWVTNRVRSATPRPEWRWVEGDDPRISWAQIHEFSIPLELTDATGGEDGFVKLARTPHNEQVLRQFSE